MGGLTKIIIVVVIVTTIIIIIIMIIVWYKIAKTGIDATKQPFTEKCKQAFSCAFIEPFIGRSNKQPIYDISVDQYQSQRMNGFNQYCNPDTLHNRQKQRSIMSSCQQQQIPVNGGSISKKTLKHDFMDSMQATYALDEQKSHTKNSKDIVSKSGSSILRLVDTSEMSANTNWIGGAKQSIPRNNFSFGLVDYDAQRSDYIIPANPNDYYMPSSCKVDTFQQLKKQADQQPTVKCVRELQPDGLVNRL